LSTTYVSGNRSGKVAEQCIMMIDALTRGEVIHYYRPDGRWEFTARNLKDDPYQGEDI